MVAWVKERVAVYMMRASNRATLTNFYLHLFWRVLVFPHVDFSCLAVVAKIVIYVLHWIYYIQFTVSSHFLFSILLEYALQVPKASLVLFCKAKQKIPTKMNKISGMLFILLFAQCLIKLSVDYFVQVNFETKAKKKSANWVLFAQVPFSAVYLINVMWVLIE